MLTTRLVSGPARFHNRERRDGVKRSPVGEADRRLLAGGAGFEPAIEDPKSPALPDLATPQSARAALSIPSGLLTTGVPRPPPQT